MSFMGKAADAYGGDREAGMLSEVPRLKSPMAVGGHEEGRQALGMIRQIRAAGQGQEGTTHPIFTAGQGGSEITSPPAGELPKPQTLDGSPDLGKLVEKLPPDLQAKIAKEWAASTTDIVNKYRASQGQPPLQSTGDTAADWKQVSDQIGGLPKAEKQQVTTAYMQAITDVCGEASRSGVPGDSDTQPHLRIRNLAPLPPAGDKV
jgi:hypothetical protein